MPGVVYGAVLLGTALVQRRMFKNKDLINKAVHRCPVITRTAELRTAELRERLATHRDEIGPLQYPLLMDNIHPTLQATKGKVKIVLF